MDIRGNYGVKRMTDYKICCFFVFRYNSMEMLFEGQLCPITISNCPLQIQIMAPLTLV